MNDPLLPLPDTTPDSPQACGFPQNPTATQIRCWAKQQAFLAAFANHAIVAAACQESGVTVSCEEMWDKTDSYCFKRRKAWAARQALGKLEQEIVRRGRDGTDKPVYWRGQRVGTSKEYSDNLLMFRTKRLDPAYKDNYDPHPGQQAPIQITRIVIHGVDAAQIQVQQGTGVAPELPAGQVIEVETDESCNRSAQRITNNDADPTDSA